LLTPRPRAYQPPGLKSPLDETSGARHRRFARWHPASILGQSLSELTRHSAMTGGRAALFSA
jgi:hypothetical protein